MGERVRGRILLLRSVCGLCGLVMALAAPSWAAGVLINLAPLATATCDPAADGDSLKAVNDVSPATGLVYAVLSKDEGSVTLTFATPHQINRARVLQGERAYYSTAYRLLADEKGDGNFSTVLADVKEGAQWGEWAEHLFPPVTVKAVRFQSVAGKSEGSRAHPVVREIEVYGQATDADLQEMMRMSSLPPSAMPKLKPLYLDTPLVTSGKAVCSILVPAEPRYRELGEQIAKAVEKHLGAKPRVCGSLGEVDPAKETVIALGQMLNNKLIERLYWNHYLYVDSLCPGKNGYCIETIHNPYPWTAGHNVLVLGGSTATGVQRAVEAFEKMLPDIAKTGSLPYTLKVDLPPPGERESGYVVEGKEYTSVTLPARPLTEAEAKSLIEADPQRSLLAFQEFALKYLVTGEAAYLQAGRRVLEAMAQVYDKEPDRHPAWPEETNSRFIFAAWDAVEESPVFNDEERLRYTNMLLRFLYSQIGQTSDYGNLENNNTIIWNHTTFPLMGLYWGGRYYRRYYDCAFMDTFLKKAEGAFRGQEKSWKPQCDADSYLTLTMGHTIEYALAESRMAFFESGNIRKYADYLIGICDNRGWAAGFGDSGVQRSTAVPDAGLPYAFWFTRDPRYLGYLNAIHGGRWLNPFHQDVISQPPDNAIGVQVFPLDQQVYDYTKTRPYYGEPSGPPNVPFEQAFDKVAFRASLDPLGQYFVLDGYSRGKHLHYDGNSILKLTDKGEDWLIDGDYLVRNTTEHNMVSVIRNGRSEKLVPECAALLHHADLATHGFTETMMKDYNGVDWYRDIFWRKGDWVVLFDRMVAGAEGDFRFDTVFKCLDKGGEELVDPQRFRISRGTLLKPGNYGLTEVAQPGGGQGKSLLFGQDDSQLQCGVNLKAGRYRLTLIAKGVDSSSDSFWVSMDESAPIAFHLPLDKLGPSSSAASKTEPTPAVEVNGSGDHVLTITLREGAGPVLARIVFEDATDAKNRVEIAAVGAPLATKLPTPQKRSFYIVGSGSASCSTSRRIGSSGPVKYLFQRVGGNLKAGQGTAVQNLLYLDDIGQQKNYSIKRLNDDVVVAQLERPTLIGVGSYRGDGLTITAAMFCASAERVSLVDATSFSVRQPLFASAQPVSLELDLAAWQATLVAPQSTSLQLFGKTVALKKGRQTIRLEKNDGFRKDLEAALTVAMKQSTVPLSGSKAQSAPPAGLSERWHIGDGGDLPEVRAFTTADLDGDKRPELLICRGTELHCYTSDGKLKWSYSTDRRVRCVTVADVDNDGMLEALCGGDDEQFHILNRAGKEKSSHKMIEQLVVGQGGTRQPYVNCIVVDDLNGDGKKEIIAGCSNSQISAFDASLQRIWNRDAIYHGVRKVLTADLDGDGKKEVLAADHYGSVAIIRADGRSASRAYSELGDVAFDVGDINGDGKLEVVNGSSTGSLSAYAKPPDPTFSFNNYGYAVRQVMLMDIDGDGKAETIVASDTGYVYALDDKGDVKWRTDLESPVLSLTRGKLPMGESILAGLRSGGLRVLDLKGKLVAGGNLSTPVKLLKCADLDGDGAEEIIAVEECNRCVVLAF